MMDVPKCSTSYLQQVFDFRQGDLEWNRVGLLSKHQTDSFAKREFKLDWERLILGIVFLSVFGGIAACIASLTGSNDFLAGIACWKTAEGVSCSPTMLLFVVGFGASLFFIAAGIKASFGDVIAPTIHSTEGIYRLEFVNEDAAQAYRFRVGEEIFDITKETYEGLQMVMAVPVKIYYIKRAMKFLVLSAETTDNSEPSG